MNNRPESQSIWRVVVQDAGDGSGDLILALPTELIAQLGRKEGNALSMTKTAAGDLALQKGD